MFETNIEVKSRSVAIVILCVFALFSGVNAERRITKNFNDSLFTVMTPGSIIGESSSGSYVLRITYRGRTGQNTFELTAGVRCALDDPLFLCNEENLDPPKTFSYYLDTPAGSILQLPSTFCACLNKPVMIKLDGSSLLIKELQSLPEANPADTTDATVDSAGTTVPTTPKVQHKKRK